jgi:DNA-binding transcriptional LysR family regulator
MGGLKRGRLDIHASQTIANYWLPGRLARFHEDYPGIETNLTLGNTATVSEAVLRGAAELGFIEGAIDEPALSSAALTLDNLVIVVSASHEKAGHRGPVTPDILSGMKWVLRERGSGTRAVFEDGLRSMAIDPGSLRVALALPSNEAVLTAVRLGDYATALSEAVIAPFVENGQLAALDMHLPPRAFTLLRHKERHLSAAARQFEALCRARPE